ncbi:MAG: Undecaprenyl-phosphate galactosephosphotransferase [uncultured Solirubrobacteraceae bacterium]|uniref:Undecaprenyl-phosphate galactosephosphotransferase n=1 Tax=uncultured Solirubrobacteraceae bacterium TaxID=1162706 RepID=A0A6J4RVH4_9ACTN|nr:MAG: Undecaprenyl-phosphate galactosephosphotransferase [uncultured Solirubrobacteraceae bacterium]
MPVTHEATEAQETDDVPTLVRPSLPERDVRAKRPALLGFVLKLDTLRRLARVISLLALDFAGLFGAIFSALALKAALLDDWNPAASLQETQNTISFAYLITALLFARSGLYAERATRPGLTRIVGSLFQTTVVTLIFALINGERFSSYYIFYGTLFFAVVYIASTRWAYEKLTGIVLRAAGYQRRAVLVGTGKHIEAVAHALKDAPDHAGIEVVGFISLAPRPDNGLRSLGTLDEIERVLSEHRLDEAIIADPDFPQVQAVELVDRCHQRGVRVRVAPSTMEILIHRAEFVPGQSVPLFELKPPVFDGIDYAVKRAFDLVLSVVILLVLSPLLLGIAVAVFATSRGPVFYRSGRPGIGGLPFACLKFRTMHRDADQRQADLESLNEAAGALFKIRHDPRMTRVGRFLRKYSLDELPQLINVLRGEMSLVGPRPLPQRDFDRLEDWHRKRYLVLPGITGLWQVSGRSELDFDDLVRLDFLYLERWSPFLDLTILLKTIPAVLSRRGAF